MTPRQQQRTSGPGTAATAPAGKEALPSVGIANEWSVTEILQAVSGLDFDRGLDVVRGDVRTYSRILALFAETHFKDIARLEEYRTGGNIAGLKEVSHTLKGSAGSVGALKLSDAAKHLHALIIKESPTDEIDASCRVLIAKLERTLAELREALGD